MVLSVSSLSTARLTAAVAAAAVPQDLAFVRVVALFAHLLLMSIGPTLTTRSAFPLVSALVAGRGRRL